MKAWTLPKTAKFGDSVYRLNADFRDILEIISYLTDQTKPEYIRWRIAVGLFYEEEIPNAHYHEAIQYLSDFISYGAKDAKPGPKLIDWDIDAQMIIADINKTAGREIRSEPFIHWWTFLSYFYGIGEGQLSTVVSIRNKKAKGKSLEKWEQEFYKENKSIVDMKSPDTEKIRAEKENILKYL